MVDVVERFEVALVGCVCAINRRDHDWEFRFGDAGSLVIESPWRLVADTGIVMADTDDGQLFGLKQPYDVQARANEALGIAKVSAVHVNRRTGDVDVVFTNGNAVQIWCNSVGYESWTARFQSGPDQFGLVAQGGGQLSFWLKTGAPHITARPV